MMNNVLCFSIIVLMYTSCSADYSRHRLLTATPETTKQLDSLAGFLNRRSAQGHVDVWNLPGDLSRRAMFSVSGDKLRYFTTWLVRRGIHYSVDSQDLQSLSERYARTEATKEANPRLRSLDSELSLDVYNDHIMINAFLEDTARICEICSVLHLGQSYEERDMDVIQIGREGQGKPVVWLDAGIHAREWIAPATALKIIDNLVTGYLSGDEDVTWLLERYVLIILPSANPDGYTYSRTKDRYWRKTRRPNKGRCVGSDPNRNWGFHWAEAGSSSNPCSEIFPGPRPFSEVEARNIRNYILQNRNRILVYLSLHSYGQYWMYPWGYDSSLPDNWRELQRVGERAVNKIVDISGKNYTLGSSTNVLYAAAGASDDWAKGVANITYSYTVELRDEGEHGFLLPSDQIEPTSAEMFGALLEMMRAIDEERDHSVA